MDYMEFREERIVDVIRSKVEAAIKAGEYGDAIYYLYSMERNHSWNEKLSGEEGVIRVYCVLESGDFIPRIRSREYESDVGEENCDDQIGVDIDVLKETLLMRMEREMQSLHRKSSEYIANLMVRLGINMKEAV